MFGLILIASSCYLMQWDVVQCRLVWLLPQPEHESKEFLGRGLGNCLDILGTKYFTIFNDNVWTFLYILLTSRSQKYRFYQDCVHVCKLYSRSNYLVSFTLGFNQHAFFFF